MTNVSEERGANREKIKRLLILAATALVTFGVGRATVTAPAPLAGERQPLRIDLALKEPIKAVLSDTITVRVEVVPLIVGPDGKPVKK